MSSDNINAKLIFEINELIYSSLSEIDDLSLSLDFDSKVGNVAKLTASSNRFWIIRLLLIPNSLEFLKSSYRLVLGREPDFAEYSSIYQNLILRHTTRISILNTMFGADLQVEKNKYISKINVAKFVIEHVHNNLLKFRILQLISRHAWLYIPKNNKAYQAELSSHLNVMKHKQLISFKVSEKNDIELEIMAKDWIEYNRNLKKVS